MDPVFVIAIITVLVIVCLGLFGGAMATGHASDHNHSLISRIIDWLF